MGKVQKKANDRHKINLSPALTEFISKTTSLPLIQLPQLLSSFPFRWPFPRGDLYNWIDTLDRFDEILHTFSKAYGLDVGPQTKVFGTTVIAEGDASVDAAALQQYGPDGDRVLVESILAFSRLLLEKCGNRTLYNSTERLNDLLNTTSLPLLHETLRLTHVLAQRFADRGPQAPGGAQFYHFDLDRLLKLAAQVPRQIQRRGPVSPLKTPKNKDKSAQPKLRRAPTVADPNDLRALAKPTSPLSNDALSQVLDWSSVASVRVVWTPKDSSATMQRPILNSRSSQQNILSSPTPIRQQQTPSRNGPVPPIDTAIQTPNTDSSGLRYIELDAAELQSTTPEQILAKEMPEMPESSRYELLHKLRLAYGMIASDESRLLLVYVRLTALGVIGQVYLEEELTAKYFDGDGNASARQQLVQVLVDLLREPKDSRSIPLYLQSLAMETLAIMSRYRQMMGEILSSLTPNSSHGLLMSLIQKGIVDIQTDGDETDNEEGDLWRHAVFMMWMVFMNPSVLHPTRSTEQFMHKNLITAYASGLRILTQKSLRIHVCIVKFLEHLFHSFKDGLQVLNANGAFGLVCDLTEKLSDQALELCNAGQGAPDEWKTKGMDYRIPYMQQYVLREVIGLIKDVSKHQGNHADRALRGFVDSRNLLNAFRLVLSHIDEFGAHTWSEVVTAVCAFLNNEPTSYTVVSEAGIITTLLATVQPEQAPPSAEDGPRTISAKPSGKPLRLPPSADAIVNLATSFTAICLTEAGNRRFVESGVLEKFFELFESAEHVKAIKDTSVLVNLGPTFDELVRHHPMLKDLVVSSIATMIARVRYICRTDFQAIGAGPKIWLKDSSGLFVDGGNEALTVEDIPRGRTDSLDFTPFKLPNGIVLESGVQAVTADPTLARHARDENNNGLTASDYARPAIAFLASFLDSHSLCKELLSTGVTDLILDLVTLPTLPISDEAFGEGIMLQDLATVIRQVTEEKPHLVLPLLIDRARYACSTALADFTQFSPGKIQCYFDRYLQVKDTYPNMDVDSEASVDEQQPNGTRVVRSLMNVYSIVRVLTEIMGISAYPRPTQHGTVLALINISDLLSELMLQLGRLSAACCREEISLNAMLPRSWLDATRPGCYSTGDSDLDTILDVSDNPEGNPVPKLVAEQENTPAFRNLQTLRYLVSETPAIISTFFSRTTLSFSGRKRPDTFLKQKLHSVADAIARAMMHQLEPVFLSKAFPDEDVDRLKDWRFKYFAVVLSRIRHSLADDISDNNMANGAPALSYVVDCFRRADGLKALDAIGTEFYEELKLCQVDKSVVFAANSGLKSCLDLFVDLTREEMSSSGQPNYFKNTDKEKPFYFNPNQTLLELRMEALPLTRRIWDSEYAEQASGDVVRRLTFILKHVLKGDNEDNVFARVEDFPEPKSFERREYSIDRAKLNTLREKGFEQELAEEALYRCNVGGHSTSMTAAEEYCRAQHENPYRRLLPAPSIDIKYKGSSTETPMSQVTGPPTAMEITSGPTATIHEDSSQDEDLEEGLEMGRPREIPTSLPRLPDLPQSDMHTASASITETLSASAHVYDNRYSKQSIDAERDSIREELFERCNNVLSSHPTVIFDLNELLCAGASKLPEDEGREWWETGTNLLVTSLLSQGTEDDMDKTQGQKVAATAHLIGLLCNNGTFKPSMLKVLQDSLDEIVGFLQLPGPNSDGDEAYPWIAPVLLIVERMLALDAEPDSIEWTAPNDLDSYVEPKIVHNEVVNKQSKTNIFQRLMDILPKVGKSKSMALAIARVLVILTRDRQLAQLQGERRHLQKLFLMVKQLSGRATGRLQAPLMMVLRHVIEDDATIKQIMGTEIVAWFRNRSGGRQADLRAYLNDLSFLALRSPALFVEVSNEKVKLASWASGQQGASSPLTLRSSSPEQVAMEEIPSHHPVTTEAAESVEPHNEPFTSDEKVQEVKVPTVEHPDGVVHFLLSELLSYKEVEDKDLSQVVVKEDSADGASSSNPTTDTAQTNTTATSEKPAKPRFTTDEHPIFMYRCFILHCLTELLYSYNQTKIEFISFSRKADPLAATPSKARSGVLNYLLNSLVSSGYVDKDESIACRKRMSASEWAMRVLVALCTKTGEKDLGVATNSRYSTHARNVEDNDTEPDLTYVRRFVLDHAVKAFKDTVASPEAIQTRYGRLLCLAELFHKLITKPSGVDGTAFSNNTSYKRIARMMLEKNFIAVLTSAISDVDLSFPSAKKVIKFILRPLKELTSTATDLSINSPEDFPQIIDQAVTESISSASSEVSDLNDDREETPDLYRNSALGMLDPARQDGSDSEDEEDVDEQMDFDEYEDEMDYGEEMAAPVNDGEVVSDEELEDAIDGAGPMEGLSGDVPMDIEFVVNRHHHHRHDDDDDDDSESSSSDDDDTEDDEDDHEEIEVIEDGDIENDGSEGQDDEDGWEDEDEDGVDDIEDGDEDDPMIMIEDRLQDFPDVDQGHPSLPHITDLLRTLDEADLGTPELAHDGHAILQTNNGEDQDDENEDDDDDDDDDDQGDNDGMDYDQPFDMMLDGPDYDENEDFGFDEPPPPAYQRRRGMAARVPGRGMHGDGRIIGIHDGRDMHHMLSSRHHRHAPPLRSSADDGLNPLLERPGMVPGGGENLAVMGQPIGFTLTGGPGGTIPFFPPGGGQAVITMDGSLGLGGHGAILDAIMGAIQRGDSDLLQNGRISFNVGPPTGIRDGIRPPLTPNVFNRPAREDAHKSVAFLPMLTVSRWQAEADVVFGAKNLPTKIHPIQVRVFAVLVPLAQKEEKERQQKQEDERKAKAEREAQAKAEAERLQKEEEERIAKEKAEAEERAREEAEARAAVEAEQNQLAEPILAVDDAMEGVQSEDAVNEVTAPAEDRPRTYTTIRGQQLDITGLDIDAEYLEALPEEIREEVITSQYQMRREQAQEQGNDDSAIDQEFLDALPEDIREEIRAQEAAAQRRRDRERARREAQVSGSANNQQDVGMEPDDFLATLEPALRRAILAEQPPEILNSLNAQHAAEGRAHARNMFFQRMPIAAGGELAAVRRVAAAQRDTRRQQIVQLIDKAGVATLLRLMFMQQQGSLKANLLGILSQICGNRQTRYEVVSLLLVILKEGSTDVTAIERSLASLSLRAKASASQKTPQPLKRTLSMQPYAGLGEDVTPMMVVQQCLITLSHICRHNPHVKSLFLREVDVTSTSKLKSKLKGKTKESKTTTHPVNDLIGLLDRRLIMDSAGCLQYLAALLATVTSPLAGLMKQERERIKAEQEAEMKAKIEKEQKEKEAEKAEDNTKTDVAMEDVAESSTTKEDAKPEGAEDEVSKKDRDEGVQPTDSDRRRAFEPPTIADENLKLITSIFVAPECGQETFKATLETLQSLSHIPGTSEKFGEELKVHVRVLSQSICKELDDLLPVIEDAQTSTDVSGAAAAKFSASTSDQVKLLRVLQALDYLSLSKKDGDNSGERKPKSILTMAYESLGLSPLWNKLSECLSAVEEKGDTISFANILLPLIESLMVVCKHTTLKEAPVQVKDAVLTSPVVATHQDELEELFFKFSSDHRKILNDIVRQNPKLMQGHFSILVKNSKVLDFDNKRNYFSKQIHSRHHNNRHPQPPLQLNVRRDQVFIDSYKALYYKTAEEMKYGKLNIRFNGEEGVDAGGVTREWFQVLARGMFDPNYALFQPVASDKTTFHPSTLSFVNPEHLLYFKFIGRIIGKALHEGRVLDCHFSRAVYKRILGKKPNLKDLESNDMDYYKSLCWILENDITDILEEDFSVIENEFGEEKTIDLIPNGRTISVTEDNKKEYVQKLVEYRLTESVKEQLDHFLGGFHDIIPAELISIFNEQELELLISGLPEIDVDDWKANTEYHNYNPSSQQIVWFWRIVKAMTNEERAKLLQFITGTSKVPLNGFKELEGVSGLTRCNIHKDPSTNRLPTSHTCFNQLDLPAYESFEIMKQNITTAISLGADYFGFA